MIKWPSASDVLLGTVLAGVLSVVTLGFFSLQTLPIFGAVLAIGGGVITMWRRVYPVVSATIIFLVGLTHFLVNRTLLPTDLLVLLALYSVTVYGPRWASFTALGGAMSGGLMLASTYASTFSEGKEQLSTLLLVTVASWGVLLAVWAGGLVQHSRLSTIATLRERAHYLEIERDQQAKLAVASERTRIAREMHDVVAHTLSVVIAQADGGRYAAMTNPAAAQHSLETIADMARGALADIRSIIGVLRDSESETAPLVPQPVDEDLDELLAGVRDSGAQVSLVRAGIPRALPVGVGGALYRITQEALTNALKHAGPGAAITVLLQWAPSSIIVQIDDDGRGTSAPNDGAGHGLIGMQERAAAFGGTVDWGPRSGGGFRVKATIPTPGAGGGKTKEDMNYD